jgi:fused signal recognition particle receptor
VTQTLWIVIVVVAVLIVLAVVLGLVLRRSRRISLREAEKREELPPRGGTYKAEGGFTFTAGGDAPAPPKVTDTPSRGRIGDARPAGGATPAADAAPVAPPKGERGPAAPAGAPAVDAGPAAAPPEQRPATAPRRKGPATAPDEERPPADAPAATAPPVERPPVEPPATASPADGAPTTAPPAERPASAPAAERPAAAPPAAERPAAAPPAAERPAAAPPGAERPAAAPPAASAPPAERPATAPAEERPSAGSAATAPPAATAPATTPSPAAAPTTPATPTAPATQAPATTNGAAASAAITPTPTDITPPEGRLERLRGRLSRSRSGFGQGLLAVLGAGELDEESWEDVETLLLQADLGPEMTVELVDTLRTELARRAVRTPEQARVLLRDVLTDALRTDLDRSVRALPHDGRPAVLLIVGVNGTGKTTTTGKLARVLVASGRHVVLGAADTFRAAAAEQLATWGERAGATVIRGPEGADPASVAFDAVKQGDEEGADAVLLDTAGRLHTKTGLMDELGKVKRVVSRQALVDEVLLVLDATTGQNGLTQARVFGDVVDVTGIVLTKLDGTAKGGIVFRVQRELGVPVKLVGLGEGPDDLAPFEPAAFVDALLE